MTPSEDADSTERICTGKPGCKWVSVNIEVSRKISLPPLSVPLVATGQTTNRNLTRCLNFRQEFFYFFIEKLIASMKRQAVCIDGILWFELLTFSQRENPVNPFMGISEQPASPAPVGY